jgi:hypothetical protein
VYVQDWLRTGVPVQPDGDDEATVRVCVPLDEHVLHAEYVYVHAGATYVQAWLSTGVPVQPEGDDEATVRVCVPLDEHVLHAE